MKVGSLFSGIGGFDLGLERAGMEVRWQVENDPYCQRVLKQHWPDVPLYPDVNTLKLGELEHVEVIAGGFPCQDTSIAGKGAGISGLNSRLWERFAWVIANLQPNYVIVENVTALRSRGLSRVLGQLASCGYDAEWDCIPASAFGAPHRRDRIWIVAYLGKTMANTESGWGEGRRVFNLPANALTAERFAWGIPASGRVRGRNRFWASAWDTEPAIRRVDDGIPHQLDRLRALGNSLVPQIAEWIGGRIIEYETTAQTQESVLQ